MNIGNITSNNFNLDVTGKDIQIEVYEQLIGQLQQENKQLREKVNKFNIDKINNENKSLKGSCKILGEKNNNQRKELQRLNNKIEKLKVINYNTQQFKWAKEIMKEKDINILDINWNKFKTKEEIEQFIDMLNEGTKDLLKDSDINE